MVNLCLLFLYDICNCIQIILFLKLSEGIKFKLPRYIIYKMSLHNTIYIIIHLYI